MEILFVTPELTRRDTPLGRIANALPKGLRGADHHVTVVSPLYADIDPSARQLARRLTGLELQHEGETYTCELYDGRTAAGVELLFIGHAELFGSVQHMEEGDEATVARRAGLFARAVEGLVETREPRPELLHAIGWPGALAVMRAHGSVPTVLTLHELAGQGRFPPDLAGALGVPDALRGPAGAEHEGKLDTVKAGLLRADRVATGSLRYAREVLEGTEQSSLRSVLADLGDRFTGVVHGVDGSVWNPAIDPQLASRYDPMDLSGKRQCKAALQMDMGLPLRPDVCVIGCAEHGTEPDGMALFAAGAEDVLRNDVQLAVRLAEGSAHAGALEELASKFPERLAVRSPAAEPEVHRLVGGCDVLVVPNRRAPCGHLEMVAHRYGALPVVRRVGAYADSVVDCDAELRTGNGFVFDGEDPRELASTLARAASAFTRDEAFTALQRRAMRVDHSWERTARLYDRQYRLALGAED